MAIHEEIVKCSCGESVSLRFSEDMFRKNYGYSLLGGDGVWEHWYHLYQSGKLAAQFHGPETYGAVSIYVVVEKLNN